MEGPGWERRQKGEGESIIRYYGWEIELKPGGPRERMEIGNLGGRRWENPLEGPGDLGGKTINGETFNDVLFSREGKLLQSTSSRGTGHQVEGCGCHSIVKSSDSELFLYEGISQTKNGEDEKMKV